MAGECRQLDSLDDGLVPPLGGVPGKLISPVGPLPEGGHSKTRTIGIDPKEHGVCHPKTSFGFCSTTLFLNQTLTWKLQQILDSLNCNSLQAVKAILSLSDKIQLATIPAPWSFLPINCILQAHPDQSVILLPIEFLVQDKIADRNYCSYLIYSRLCAGGNGVQWPTLH